MMGEDWHLIMLKLMSCKGNVEGASFALLVIVLGMLLVRPPATRLRSMCAVPRAQHRMLRSAPRQVTNLFVGALSDGFIEGIKEEEAASNAEKMARRNAYAMAKGAGADEETLRKLELSSVGSIHRLKILCRRLGLSRIADIKDKIVRQTTESIVRLRKSRRALVADTKLYKAYRCLSCVAKMIVSNEWFQHVRCLIEPLPLQRHCSVDRRCAVSSHGIGKAYAARHRSCAPAGQAVAQAIPVGSAKL